MPLPSAQASYSRALTARLGKNARRLERGKNKPQGMLGRDKRERRPLPDFVRFSGRICGSVVLAKPGTI